MIEIVKRTEEKCEDCMEFCPEIQNSTYYSDGRIVNVSFLYCGHWKLCDRLEQFLRKKQEVDEQ